MTSSLLPRDTSAARFVQTPFCMEKTCREELGKSLFAYERPVQGTAGDGCDSGGRNYQNGSSGAMRAGMLSASATVAVLAVAALSLIHPWGNLRSSAGEGGAILPGANVPNDVRTLVTRKCGDCHSNGTRWPLYSKIAPASWLVEHDVHEGRERLNLSSWEHYGIDARIDLLGKMSTQLRQGKMPLKQYLLLHPEARLSEPERKLVVEWTKVERRRLVVEADGNKPSIEPTRKTEMK